jgi:hypothetical protein
MLGLKHPMKPLPATPSAVSTMTTHTAIMQPFFSVDSLSLEMDTGNGASRTD